jgi:phosphatidylglycerol:prolipoprotein diacylglycerol transferase
LYIPNEDVIGIPVFGLGWLLMAWGVFSIVLWIWLLRTQRSQREVWGHVPLLVLVAAVIWFLLPRLCQPIPGGGELKGLPIHAWGMMVLVALTSAVGVAAWRGRRLGIDPEVIFTLAFWVVVPGIIGARAFYVIEYWEHFRRQTFGQTVMAVINVTQGGLVVYGSFMGAVVGLVGFFHKYKMPRLATLDLIAPSLMLGVAIGRVGCFLNGCCFGGICELPWAVTFPSSPTPSPAYIYQVQHGDIFLQGLKIVGDPSKDPVITEVQPGSAAEKQGLEPGQRVVSINGQLMGTVEQAQWMLMNAQRAENRIVIRTHGSASVAEWPVTGPPPRSEPVHPTQLYSSLNGLLLFVLLVAYARFRRRDGEVFAMLLTLYPVTRFVIEIIRTDEPGVFGTGLTISQTISLVLVFGAVVLWIYVLMKPARNAFAKSEQSNTRR